MEILLVDIKELTKALDVIVKISDCIKPHYYLLKAYFGLIHARTLTSTSYLRKAKKSAQLEKNLLALASIIRNKNVSYIEEKKEKTTMYIYMLYLFDLICNNL